MKEDMERRSIKEDMERRNMKENMERRSMKEDMERKRMEAAERTKSLNSNTCDELMFDLLMHATARISERTESLNRSLKKSNSFKKTQTLVLLPKIDNKLEQYTHAVEDAEGLKVGVANRITQWVKGPADGSRASPGRATEVRPGDVMQKKNMWEVIGDSESPRAKGSAARKKYKFVVTGHGKYEKLPTDGENGREFTDGDSADPQTPTFNIQKHKFTLLASNFGLKSRTGSRWANEGISFNSSFCTSSFASFASSLLFISIWCMMFSLVENIWKRTAFHIFAATGASLVWFSS
ncbi:Lymphocyte-specific protein 1 [Liparis tanakae]|uniref:Lymphocyte-specific protein 1 n=1 Tax=Liparis tanakae TaxID=230148 RepID=A0A4Z2G7N6_9TELE|nr:Lymphocyte-specific protein 1 [Liparis tanakae]